jgi:hypothetical protein
MKIFGKNVRRRKATVMASAAKSVPTVTSPKVPSRSAETASTSQPPAATFVVENNKMIAMSKIDMKNQKIASLANPSEAGDAVNLIYLHSYLNDKYMKKNDAQNVVLRQLGNPVEKSDACTKGYVDNAISLIGKQQDKSIKIIYMPSQANGIFSPGIVVKDIKILHVMFSGGSIQHDRIRLFSVVKVGKDKEEKKELRPNKALEYEMNQKCETYTSVNFEILPMVNSPISISIFYVEQTFENKFKPLL